MLDGEILRYNDQSGSSDEVFQWPNTIGYVFNSEGIPVSEEATKLAFEAFAAIREEIKNYYRYIMKFYLQCTSFTAFRI